jgi:hypothetical protein
VQSSCDASTEHHVDTIDDASNSLSMLAQGVQSDGTAVQVEGQHSNIFQSQCKIQDKVCKFIIDGGSFTYAISSDLVAALSLSTRRLPTPCYMQWMNQSGMLKITDKMRFKFSIGNYIDTMDYDVAPLCVCHLLLGRLWQFDLDATHGGRSNSYSFMHKGIQHVLKPVIESAIKAEAIAPVKKKFHAATIKPKPRMALLQGEENDVTISNTSDEPPTKECPQIISKPRLVFLKGGEYTMTTISAPSTTVVVNSINPIQIQFGTLYFGVKIEDDENNMVPVAPCMSNKNRR